MAYKRFPDTTSAGKSIRYLTEEQALSVGITPAAYRGKPGRDGKPPIIGENGNWWQYDCELDAYVDSGKPASVAKALYTVGSSEQLPEIGTPGIIYVVTGDNAIYRWDSVSEGYRIIKTSGTGETESVVCSTYVHKQTTAAIQWDIYHNLDKYPSVTIVDSAGTQVYGDISYVDSNHLIITFTSEFGGRAYLN